MKTIFNQLVEVVDMVKKDENFEHFRLEALHEFVEFLESGVWNGKKVDRGKKVVETSLMNEADASKKLELSPASVRKLRARASNKIKNQVGSDCIDKILGGSREEVSNVSDRFKAYKNSIEDLIFPELLLTVNFKNVKPRDSFNVKEFENELKFLRRFSYSIFKQKLVELDQEKMQYIFSIICSQSYRDIVNKAMITRYLTKI